MSAQPLVTVVTPCWNSIEFIDRTILSIRKQTYKNIEFIVVDGGSTDGTLEIIKGHADGISWWISEPDKGMYHAINKGLVQASGEIVSYLNSDDIYYPDTISNVVKIFAQQPQADLIYGNLDIIDEQDKVLYNQIYPDFSAKHFANANYSMIGQPASFWRRGLLEKIGLFDESFKMVADFDFFVRAGVAGKMVHVDETLAAFRVHAKSLTSRQLELNFREIGLMRKKHGVEYMRLSNKISRVAYDIYFKLINYRSLKNRILVGRQHPEVFHA
jgi:glycosyltransferase involved in cell wall biosynthesis